MSRVINFCKTPAADRRLAVEAALWLGLARAAVKTLPFRWIASTLGEEGEAADQDESLPLLTNLNTKRIGWMVRRVSRHTPWKSNCLAQAIAGQRMLRRRQISNTIYFGMFKCEKGEFEAHAWLRSGEIVLTGGDEMDQCVVVKSFTKE